MHFLFGKRWISSLPCYFYWRSHGHYAADLRSGWWSLKVEEGHIWGWKKCSFWDAPDQSQFVRFKWPFAIRITRFLINCGCSMVFPGHLRGHIMRQFIKEESRYCDGDTRLIGKFIIPIAHPNIMTISPLHITNQFASSRFSNKKKTRRDLFFFRYVFILFSLSGWPNGGKPRSNANGYEVHQLCPDVQTNGSSPALQSTKRSHR